MHRYLVSFLKTVTDGSGHDRQVLQHQTLVRAQSEVAALFEAKALFRYESGLADWRLGADACKAVAITGRDAASRVVPPSGGRP
ncbi:MAG: hypothetical protein INR70_25755 [Parafilimonas terrae]|nr:hypothetical protein [Parafilimonas terrae]